MFVKVKNYLVQNTSAAPLSVFRMIFGTMMFASIVRFWHNGWIEDFYIKPRFFFSYYGFEWVKPLGIYTYVLFAICALAALGIALGYKYRFSAILFFLSFTYTELMDKTTYLNHYYFISLMAFLMIFLPANAYFSVDAYLKKSEKKYIPRWTIFSVQFMLSIVYFYAGLAKLNSDWLFNAMPLKIWLPPHHEMPIVGELFSQTWFLYFMSWGGAIYDLAIPFLLFNRKTRFIGFLFVLFFHIFTRILFPIGMFPFIMIGSTLIFFDAKYHQRFIDFLRKILRKLNFKKIATSEVPYKYPAFLNRPIQVLFVLFFIVQIVFPFRYLLYPGELFWTEEGFRFSWRVMLMEKAGYTSFIIKDKNSDKRTIVEARDYLTPFQEKQMSFQPDFIIEFAQYLAQEFKKRGYENPQVFAQSYVALNGRGSVQYIDPTVDLAQEKDSWKHKTFILPFNHEIKGL
ncbi:HTTM domain-containing protein [Ornithobacterium rhinotracheale]|uniref:HTTM domain-containing protein n=1 Tax=Ornithobacterium rhinotracheale TaxID=28251 RepID=UPI001FF35B74|nr:HTTM domain-containing protein [Ornithobacterium rhinotracheale]MCK0204242.1 HTTM domain-containing protein [Ornithobacterium rhinotracheale]